MGSGSAEFRVAVEQLPPKLSFPIREGWSTEAQDALESRLTLQYGAALEGVRDARDISPNRLFTPDYYRFWMQMMQWKGQLDYRPLAGYNVRYMVAPAGSVRPAGVRPVT